MIPYFPQPVWTVGAVSIYAFGVVEAIALVGGYALVMWRAHGAGLDDRRTGWLFTAMLVVGLTTGALWGWPRESAGGMIAGVLAVAAVAAYVAGTVILPHIDVLASAGPLIGCVARFGCFLAHDHRGRPSDGWFAVRFPEGSRLDLGLVECVVGLAAAGPVWWLWRSRLTPGVVTLVVVLAWSAVRIFIGYLR